MIYCHQCVFFSCHHCPSLSFYILIFFSKTTGPRLGRNVHWMIHHKRYVLFNIILRTLQKHEAQGGISGFSNYVMWSVYFSNSFEFFFHFWFQSIFNDSDLFMIYWAKTQNFLFLFKWDFNRAFLFRFLVKFLDWIFQTGFKYNVN